MRPIRIGALPKKISAYLAGLQNQWNRRSPKWRAKNDDNFGISGWQSQSGRLAYYQFGKCAYCEITCIGDTNGAVEHFWPKSKYYTHRFKWRNWMLSCKRCNSAKYTRDAKKEKWINPTKSDPIEFFEISSTGILGPRDWLNQAERRRVKNTIDGANLNCLRKGIKRPRYIIEYRLAACVALEKLIKSYNNPKGKTPSERAIVQKITAQMIVNNCSAQESEFRGSMLMWLLSAYIGGRIPKKLYLDAERALINNQRKFPFKP